MKFPVRLLADASLLLSTAIWGLSFVLVKGSLAGADPFTFLALRFGLAALVAGAIAGRRLFERENLRPAATLSLLLFAGFAFQTWGLEFTTTARSAFLTGLCVLLVPVLAVLLFRHRPQFFSMLGVVLAAVGIYVMTGGLGPSADETTRFGDLLTILCAVAYAGHILGTDRYSRQRPAMPLVAWQFFGVSVLSAAVLPFVERRLVLNTPTVVGIVTTAMLASVLAISLQTWAQKRTTATRAALIFTLEPVFASFFAFLLAGEALTSIEFLGAGIILAAVVVAEVGNAVMARRRGEPEPTETLFEG